MSLLCKSRAAIIYLRPYWLELLGFCLLCYVAVTALILIPQVKKQNKELNEKIQATKVNLFQFGQSNYPDKKDDVRSHLATFNRLSYISSDLNSNGLENGLQISDVSYQPVAATNTAGISTIQIAVHLRGNYPSAKKMIAGLLAAHDGLALESITVERANPTDVVSTIELNFIFYYR